MDRQSVVRDLDLLSALTLAVPIAPEKQGGPRQAVKLSYTDDFDFVQGVLRGLLTVNQGEKSTDDTTTTTNNTPSTPSPSSSQLSIMERPKFLCDISEESTRRGTGMPSEDWAPIYLITQGSVIDKCGAHYGAWKFRRDIITSPELFEKCAFESAKFPVPVDTTIPKEWKKRYERENIPTTVNATMRDFVWSDVNEFCKSTTEPTTTSKAHHRHASDEDDDGESSFETIDSANEELWAELQRERCASLRVILPSIAGGDFTSNGGYCVWRAVAWELAQCKTFARRNHKNFQVWHHRRELIAFGLANSDKNTPFTDILPFDEIDERILCDKVLEDDSKNYHVWSHRCWFVSAFSELNTIDVTAMVNQSSKADAAETSSSSVQHNNHTESDDELINEIRARNEAKEVEPYSLPVSSGAVVIGGLEQEFNYSGRLIHNDVFNNSAWSYRMLLLRQFVVERGFLTAITKALAEGEEKEVLNMCHALFNNVLIAEIKFAVYWASVEVCNECPFTYARGVAALASDAIHTIMNTSSKSTSLIDAILHQYIALFDSNNTVSESTTNTNRDENDSITARGRIVASMPHMYVHRQLSSNILTKALLVSEQVKDSSTPYGKRTAFVRNNTHQCIAGMFHSAFDLHTAYWGSMLQNSNTNTSNLSVLKSLKGALSAAKMAPLLSDPVLTGTWTLDNITTWGSQFTDHLRKVAEGITNDVLLVDFDSSDDQQQVVAPPNPDDMVNWIYSHIVCLALGRLLTREDSIRYKYWKAQIHDLLHFRMLV